MSILMAALGSLGFGILLRMKPRQLPFATLGGAITWAVYLLFAGEGVFAANLAAALAANFWALLMARIRRAPAVIFTITAAVPLIPGSGLYYTMAALVKENYVLAAERGLETLLTAAAIGFGTLLAAAGLHTVRRLAAMRPFQGESGKKRERNKR